MSSYCLRRNNHCFDLADHFERMFKEESMVDVTLSCGNGCIKAHRMVLSACSSYFNEIFSKFNAPHQYPIVIIKDMPFDDLRSIIEFIYRGEVTVPHNRLSSVLRSAEALKVKGLQDAKSQMDGKSMRKRRKKRRKGNRKTNNDDGGSHDDTSGQGGNSNQNHDANGDTSDNEPGNNNNNNNNGDKSKDGSASEDEATSEYTDEEEDEEMENEINGHGIMVTQHHGRNTNNTDADIEPSRLLEQSMITVDERNERNNGHTPKFQSNLSISDSNLNSDLSLKPIMFGDNDNSDDSISRDATLKGFKKAKTGSNGVGKQRYQCHICFQLFTEKRNLQRHHTIHSGARNKYECEHCSKIFCWKHTYNAHKEKVHGILDLGVGKAD
ncbi:uncharacterized protein LOC141850594 isoform X2 [Brevipalpus obovatus]|uniref:uncharacterized protein LOC141850594 isoform X2 n=1 Tax=Brevipalpus obovatus TaxID=246614 RepID=UPI003D9E561E